MCDLPGVSFADLGREMLGVPEWGRFLAMPVGVGHRPSVGVTAFYVRASNPC